jgi:hypothetical protein
MGTIRFLGEKGESNKWKSTSIQLHLVQHKGLKIYTIPLKNKTAEVREAKFNDVWAKRMEEELIKLLLKFFNNTESWILQWVAGLKNMMYVLRKLKK